MVLEQLQHVLVEGFLPEVVPGAELGEEVRRKIADVLQPLSQRRDSNRDDAQAVVEIVAELAVRNPLFQSPVGRRDHAY
jgi:hypothetical protein